MPTALHAGNRTLEKRLLTSSQGSRSRVEKAIRALVLLSILLGVLFLAQAYGAVPSSVFEFVAVGWVLFVADALLMIRYRRPAYALAFVLALLALVSSLPQSSHWAFVTGGDVLPAATFLGGAALQLVLLVLVPYYFISRGRGTS